MHEVYSYQTVQEGCLTEKVLGGFSAVWKYKICHKAVVAKMKKRLTTNRPGVIICKVIYFTWV